MFTEKLISPSRDHISKQVVLRGKGLQGNQFRYIGTIRDINGSVVFVDWVKKPSREATLCYQSGKAFLYLEP